MASSARGFSTAGRWGEAATSNPFTPEALATAAPPPGVVGHARDRLQLDALVGEAMISCQVMAGSEPPVILFVDW